MGIQTIMFGKSRNLTANGSITIESTTAKFVTCSDLTIDEETGDTVDTISVTSADEGPDINGVPMKVKLRKEIYVPYMSKQTQGSNPESDKLLQTVFAAYKPGSTSHRIITKKVNFTKINDPYGYYTIVSRVLKSDQSAEVQGPVASNTRSLPLRQ